MKPLIFLLLIFLFAKTLLAGTIDPSIDDKKYIEYGEKFKYIYKICGTYESGELFCASSVVIDPHWVLTAAHVVKGARTTVVRDNNKAYLIEKIIYHEDFDKNNVGKNDIALCYTQDKILIDYYPPLYEDTDEENKVCCMAGYGLTGNFNTGVTTGDSKRRAGSNIIQYIDRDLLICDASKKGSKDHTSLEFLIASGDSGGGLFIDGKLAGINSCVLAKDKNPNSSYSDESGHTRVSLYSKWIKEKIKSFKDAKKE